MIYSYLNEVSWIQLLFLTSEVISNAKETLENKKVAPPDILFVWKTNLFENYLCEKH